MDRNGISELPKRRRGRKPRKARAAGLRLSERDGYIHLTGTLRIAGRSIRVRASTELPADQPENWDLAEGLRINKEKEVKDEIILGVSPKQSWPRAAVEYFKRRQQEYELLTGKEREVKDDPEFFRIQRFTDFLLTKGLHLAQLKEITSEIANDYVKTEFLSQKRSVSTILRYWNPVRAAFTGAKVDPPELDLPNAVDYSKIPVIGKWLYPAEVQLLIGQMAPHLQPLETVHWNTGRRSSELIWVSRRFPDYNSKQRLKTGLNLAKGREHIYLGRTKNGQPKIVWLNDVAVKAIKAALEGRTDDYDELFLTNLGTPYARGKNVAGNAIKTGFYSARERSAKIMEAPAGKGGWGDKERAKVMRTVTPHWARHNLTSHLLAAKQSKDSIKDDLGWSSIEMVERYGHDMPGLGKSRANLVQFETGGDTDTLSTRADKVKAEK